MSQYPVLVYGTLRPFGGNYEYFLEGFTTAEQDVTLDGFIMYGDGGCPFLAFGDRTVVATLVEIDPTLYDEVMKNLDALEGFRGFGSPENSYERRLHTFLLDGVEVEAWIYVASPSLLRYVQRTTPVLESGDWIAHTTGIVTIPA